MFRDAHLQYALTRFSVLWYRAWASIGVTHALAAPIFRSHKMIPPVVVWKSRAGFCDMIPLYEMIDEIALEVRASIPTGFATFIAAVR